MNQTEKGKIENEYPEAYKWAREFHNLYEHKSSFFGYETKQETRDFDPESPNGRLMAYVCLSIVQQALAENMAIVKGEIEKLETDVYAEREYLCISKEEVMGVLNKLTK